MSTVQTGKRDREPAGTDEGSSDSATKQLRGSSSGEATSSSTEHDATLVLDGTTETVTFTADQTVKINVFTKKGRLERVFLATKAPVASVGQTWTTTLAGRLHLLKPAKEEAHRSVPATLFGVSCPANAAALHTVQHAMTYFAAKLESNSKQKPTILAGCRLCGQLLTVNTGTKQNLVTHLKGHGELYDIISQAVDGVKAVAQEDVAASSSSHPNRQLSIKKVFTRAAAINKPMTRLQQLKLVQFLCRTMLSWHPFTSASSNGAQGHAKELLEAGLVSMPTLRARLIEIYAALRTSIRAKLTNVPSQQVVNNDGARRISLQFDGWTFNSLEFFSLLAFLWEGSTFTVVQLGFRPLATGQSKTTDIQAVVEAMLADWGLNLRTDVSGITTDSASNVSKYVEGLANSGLSTDSLLGWVPCFAHRMSNAVRRSAGLAGALQSQEAVKVFVDGVSKVISVSCRSSVKRATALKLAQKLADGPALKLMEANETRWIGLYQMCVRLLRLYDSATTVWKTATREPFPVPRDDLCGMVGVLHVIYEANMLFQARALSSLPASIWEVCAVHDWLTGLKDNEGWLMVPVHEVVGADLDDLKRRNDVTFAGRHPPADVARGSGNKQPHYTKLAGTWFQVEYVKRGENAFKPTGPVDMFVRNLCAEVKIRYLEGSEDGNGEQHSIGTFHVLEGDTLGLLSCLLHPQFTNFDMLGDRDMRRTHRKIATDTLMEVAQKRHKLMFPELYKAVEPVTEHEAQEDADDDAAKLKSDALYEEFGCDSDDETENETTQPCSARPG